MIKRFAKYYRPHMKIFILDMLCALLLAVCDLFYPMITRDMLDKYIPNKDLKLLIVWAVILLAIYLVKLGLNYFVNYYGHVVGVKMQADMRRDVFDHLQHLPLTYFDNNKTGTIMSRIISDLMDISELAHHGPEDLFLSAVMLIGAFVVMGSIYMKSMLGLENPRVGLLNIGTEDKKGNSLTHEVFTLLKANSQINFIGNVEARDVITGNVDVIVADGFAGNVALKSTEGAVLNILKLIKESIKEAGLLYVCNR